MPETPLHPWPGQPVPLGATWDGEGTNFAVFCTGAAAVEVCLYDDAGAEKRVPLTDVTGPVWHGYVPRIGPAQRYGYRIDGPYDPARGQRRNSAKLLMDPYARAVTGEFRLNDAVYGYPARDGAGDAASAALDQRDSAPYVPRSVVAHDAFPWGDDQPPATPLSDTVIYELHVRGFTMRHPDVPPSLQGTYAGLAHPAAIDHLTRLGVTAVELLPIHHFVSEPRLLRLGLVNYWGYNSIGYFAPHAAYSSAGSLGEQVLEFKAMVRALHAAGIEVILDVVYNHTAEGDELGPTLAFRGLDNAAYYRLNETDPSRYVDYTGCGNTLDARQPNVLQLLMDSLRYWVSECHVDGFRFDLASALARTSHDVDMRSAFCDLVQQDPVVNRVKLIAEPWDVAAGGYQLGKFPPPWTEWNGRYRDSVRDAWTSHSGRPSTTSTSELGLRLSGSSDLFQVSGRQPVASVNFITAHDGLTLRDLVSYDRKHNEANGEEGHDGTEDNRSRNCGVEGPTDDAELLALRARLSRSLMATLLLSVGVPMITAGDEMGRTQRGNNNAYCQDNEISWLDWRPDADGAALLALTRQLVALRRDHPVLRQSAFFTGQPADGSPVKDLGWFTPAGTEMTAADWTADGPPTLGVYLAGDGIRTRTGRGEPIRDDSYLMLVHTGPDPCEFVLPDPPWASLYDVEIDTAVDAAVDAAVEEPVAAGQPLTLAAHSLVLLRARH